MTSNPCTRPLSAGASDRRRALRQLLSTHHLRAAALALAAVLAPPAVLAASSAGCEGGGFAVVLPGGATLLGAQDTQVPAQAVGTGFAVRGKYVEFFVDGDTFGIRRYTFTGVSNALDITGGRRTEAYVGKFPDHRGAVLNSGVAVQIDEDTIEIARTGPGISMKIQAKDCAQGGIFQMEPARADGTATVITHVLADEAFYFDNPNFRAREGDVVPFKDTTQTVAARVNFGNDFSARFVGRDSAQVATRIAPAGGACNNPIRTRTGGTNIVNHCGGVSVWSVASGGRMGQVMGEDATEVAPPPTLCTHQCQAQNRVRGRSTVLGFPFPVPAASRLQPRYQAGFVLP